MWSQAPDQHGGKILRINDDGTVPHDNPFVNRSGYLPEIFALGIRNSIGMAFHPETGALWETENGPQGGDELNIIEPGLNYGWPVISYGINYNGMKISDRTHKDGMEQPVWYWTPSIAVCGMKFYYGQPFSPWDGNILVTSLKFEYLERVIIDDGQYAGSEIIYEPGSRVRDVEVGPNGNIFVALEDPGRIVRLTRINR